MACPYFVPVRRLDAVQQTPSPLGGLFSGSCAAGGNTGSPKRLRDCCNMGYSRGRCDDFPGGDAADAVRFAIARPEPGCVSVKYSIERDHLPVSHGCLNFDKAARTFDPPVPAKTLEALASAYIES